MASTTQPHPPSPELIFDTLNAYQKTAALRGAIELDLFTAIGEGATTAADLAGKLKVPERGARILSDYLVVTGLLTKQGGRAGLVRAESGARWKVPHIPAGQGIFGIAIARRNPNATIVGQDWRNVLEVALENARKAGVADRYETIAGSAFEADLGSGYDLILLTNFLHHFDPDTCEALLRKVQAALKPGGRAVTLEFVPNPDRASPPTAAAFALMMLGSTPSGDAYTFAEYDKMFRSAGFSSSQAHTMPGPETVIVSVK